MLTTVFRPHDIALQLKWIVQNKTATVPSAEDSRQLLPWLIAGVFALMLSASVVLWRVSKRTAQATYFFAPLPFAARDVSVSPNGHTIAVVARRESERNNVVWIYEPGAQEATALANTEGGSAPFLVS
jgi:hypothetical protein